MEWEEITEDEWGYRNILLSFWLHKFSLKIPGKSWRTKICPQILSYFPPLVMFSVKPVLDHGFWICIFGPEPRDLGDWESSPCTESIYLQWFSVPWPEDKRNVGGPHHRLHLLNGSQSRWRNAWWAELRFPLWQMISRHPFQYHSTEEETNEFTIWSLTFN